MKADLRIGAGAEPVACVEHGLLSPQLPRIIGTGQVVNRLPAAPKSALGRERHVLRGAACGTMTQRGIGRPETGPGAAE